MSEQIRGSRTVRTVQVLSMPALVNETPRQVVREIHDAMKSERIELRARLNRFESNLKRVTLEENALTFSEVKKFCELSRDLHEAALCLSCVPCIDAMDGRTLQDEIRGILEAHEKLLGMPWQKLVSTDASDSSRGDTLSKYVRNMRNRSSLLEKLLKSVPAIAIADGAYSLFSFAQEADKSNPLRECWNFLAWVTEFFRLRIEAELREAGHEVDSLRLSGEYHSRVLHNISTFIQLAFKKFRECDKIGLLKSNALLSLVNSVEACALQVSGMHKVIKKSLSLDHSVESDNRLKGLHSRLRVQLAEVCFVLGAVRKQLVDRPLSTGCLNTRNADPIELRAIVYPSVDGNGIFIAQCLDIDVVAAGSSEQMAIRELDNILDAWISEFRTRERKWVHLGVAPACYHSAYADCPARENYDPEYCKGYAFSVRSADFPVRSNYQLQSERILAGEEDLVF